MRTSFMTTSTHHIKDNGALQTVTVTHPANCLGFTVVNIDLIAAIDFANYSTGN
ncbi:MAG: hypothetical protein HC908_01770 [Calothrix sp. SM1_7_51]|nr:hypothetical protein [Calothrix sp. SM1_7_51]